MRFFCIGDEDTVRGFRLAGVMGETVATEKQARAAIGSALARPDCGILIITEEVAEWARGEVDTVRLERDRPLIVEIPGPNGPLPGRKSLREFVQEAVGVRVG